MQTFFYWVNERHRIYLNRQAGKPKPWSSDPIFQQYKFTNAFRQLDKGTEWLTNFIAPHLNEGAILLFNIAWYRLFNWTGTGDRVGWVEKWNKKQFQEILEKAFADDEQVFTGSHIIRGFKGQSKISSMCDVLGLLWDNLDETYQRVAGNTLQNAFNEMLEYPLIGGFLGYEIVTDLRHTPMLENAPDIMTWANAGPGAMRGLGRIWPEIKFRHKQDACLKGMRELLEVSPQYLEPHVPKLEMRDIEHSLCESDKYRRVRDDGGRCRNKYPGV